VRGAYLVHDESTVTCGSSAALGGSKLPRIRN
jgi:hypothetical protein